MIPQGSSCDTTAQSPAVSQANIGSCLCALLLPLCPPTTLVVRARRLLLYFLTARRPGP